MSNSVARFTKHIAQLATLCLLALTLVAGAADAAKKPVKPKKAYWYETCKTHLTCDFSGHVDAQKGKKMDFLRVTGGCQFYAGLSQVNNPVSITGRSRKFSVDTTVNAYSNKTRTTVVVTIKIDGKFKTSSKITGKYTISDPSGECTAAQMAEHKFTAKARSKQSEG